ncbi:AcrR family transcriptional regulator [Salirhabdus euzebyi]|uniref:AcrR family transcriptional regulator n=1 Tax=Salirhabdus euzebyi TaxID=394506 RepID=A0A841PU59_9BACI|nr:TetR/AcrR family transcriptional regulator [Salirhabdus euzebyi]MBB6452527.1 AcrR family transcriptional regulator [Salirhabdus euzebyi]
MSKRKELMTQSIQLFSKKGFHQTSVQEIAQRVEISKGAFYKHFESKEMLFIEILKQYYEEMMEQAHSFSHAGNLTRKEIFVEKLKIELEQWIANRDFFTVLFKDFPPNENQQVFHTMRKLKSSMAGIHRDTLLETYGTKIQPFISDLVIMMEGMLKEYMITIIVRQRIDIAVDKLANLIVSSMDGIVQALPKMEPVVTDHIPAFSLANLEEELQKRLRLLTDKISNLSLQVLEQEKLMNAVHLLKEEFLKKNPKQFLVEAMLTYIKEEKLVKEDVILIERIHEKILSQPKERR